MAQELDLALCHVNFSRQSSCIQDLGFYVGVQVFYDLPHSTPYTQFREQFVQNSVYPNCIKGFLNIKKAAENLATALKHVINCFKNSERCFGATYTLPKTKLHFRKETFMSCKAAKDALSEKQICESSLTFTSLYSYAV